MDLVAVNIYEILHEHNHDIDNATAGELNVSRLHTCTCMKQERLTAEKNRDPFVYCFSLAYGFGCSITNKILHVQSIFWQ